MVKRKSDYFWLVGLIIVIVTLFRLFNLKSTPLFGDEALYCNLGVEFSKGDLAGAWNLTVNDWKVAPLLSTLQGLVLAITPSSDPVILCRGVSVFAGSITAVLIFLLSRELTKNKSVQLAALMFALLNPFNFFSDRTSLQEPLVTMFIVLMVFLMVRVEREKSYSQIFLLIVSLFLAFLSKLSAFIALPSLLLIAFSRAKRTRGKLVLTLTVVSVIFYFWSIQYTNLWETVGYHTSADLDIGVLVRRLRGNLHLTLNWYQQYLSPWFFLVVGLGSWRVFKTKKFMWIFVPALIIGGYSLTTVGYFPRYLLLSLPFLALLVGFAAETKLGMVIVMIMILSYLRNDWKIVMQPTVANLAKEDRYQFYEDWTSGLGMEAALNFLDKEGRYNQIILPPGTGKSTFQLLYQSFKPGLKLVIHLVNSEEDLRKLLSLLDLGKTVVVTKPHLQSLINGVRNDFLVESVFASNEDRRNSVLILRLSSKNN